jgi:hypothetical protein
LTDARAAAVDDRGTAAPVHEEGETEMPRKIVVAVVAALMLCLAVTAMASAQTTTAGTGAKVAVKPKNARIKTTRAPSGVTVAQQTSTTTTARMNNNGVAECVEGTYGKDQFGNVYVCSGGKWVLWSMPAFTGQMLARG